MRFIKWLPDRALTKLLKTFRYDGLIYSHPGEIVAHVMFQRHGKDLHVFSVFVAEQHRGKQFAEKAIIGLFEYAKKRPDIERVRIGGGKHPAIERVCTDLEKRAEELGIIPAPGRWYSFRN